MHIDAHPEATLYVAFELSDTTWKLGFTTWHGQKPRERNVTARDQEGILNEIAQAKRRLGLPETAPVVSCYEAGREGFWLHRLLLAHEITNHVVDSSAIEVSRRQRRAKSDGLDVRKLLSMLIRYEQGEHRVWQVVNVPSVEAEDQRHLHRDLETLKRERASTTTRIKGLLSSQGIQVSTLTKLPDQLDALRLWDGSPIPPGLRRRIPSHWVRFQPESDLSVWFRQRFGGGGKRLRRIGIVAMSRKLLIALWRFLETGVLPEGAVLKEG